ncbi:3-keto-disaccharide hydrolase [Mucilaginibacter sp. P25]|uniref:3-keto-disaccharide hydrolase n=1 Tax=unclassified Mucilaginibacter TaxID=2617802 RepID=UPI003D67C420
MKQQFKKLGLVLAAAGLVCVHTSGIPVNNHKPAKQGTPVKGGWVNLFDGKTLKGWHGFNKKGPVKNWTIIDGALVCLGAAQGDTGGDIVTDKAYTNFELSWEWKIEKGSNSGVIYHVVEDPKYHGPYETGPEYQIIDDTGWPEKLEDWQKTGCDYAMYLPNASKR